MAKFPEREEFIKQVAEHALDKFTYCGRTIREWVAVITSTDDEFGDDIDLMLRKLRDESILCFHCDYYSDDDPDNRCDASNPENCDVRKTAKGAAALIERLYAVNCEKNAEMVLLTRDRDEWKRRAEAAEKALQEMQARVEQVEVIRTFDSGMSDDFRKFLKRWIRDDIGEMIDGKNLIQITEGPIDEHDSEMRGTVLILRPVGGGAENA